MGAGVVSVYSFQQTMQMAARPTQLPLLILIVQVFCIHLLVYHILRILKVHALQEVLPGGARTYLQMLYKEWPYTSVNDFRESRRTSRDRPRLPLRDSGHN